jgi:hypothetical protein
MLNTDIRMKSGNVAVGYMEEQEGMEHRDYTTAAYKWFIHSFLVYTRGDPKITGIEMWTAN